MEETVNIQELEINEINSIDEYLDAIMDAETEYSHLYEKSLDKEEYVYNALKKNIALVAVNAQLVEANNLEFLKNPIDMDKFKDVFLEDFNISHLFLSIFQLGISCGENLAKIEMMYASEDAPQETVN